MINGDERVGAVLLAAGSSSRMRGVDKQFLELGGSPVFMHALRTLEECAAIDSICVVFSPSNIDEGRAIIESANSVKVNCVVAGGTRRQDSVRIGFEALQSLADRSDWLVIHDAARPFVDEQMISLGLDAASGSGASVAAVALKDTVKQVEGVQVVATPDRRSLVAVQTPQVFRSDMLIAAHAAISVDVTDDASMVELIGGTVVVFEGSYDNIKITTSEDIPLAKTILDRRSGQPTDQIIRRSGIGFDGHRLVAGGPLRIGGVEVDFDQHLEGHSDGDVLLHAVSSALLGAAGLGDMGSNFPSSDESLAGIDSAELLARTLVLVRERGWEPDHLDATIIAQRPRLASHVDGITARIAEIAGVEIAAINIKVTSTDHVGAIGEGLGIAAQAVATIRSS